MSRDRSLDEFLQAGDDPDDSHDPDDDRRRDRTDDDTPDESGTSSDGSDGAASRSDRAVAPDAVEPASATYAWTPDGGACADCGRPAERRWRGGDGLVCEGCKQW